MTAKKTKSPLYTVVLMIVLAGVIVGAYFMLNRGGDGSKAEIDAPLTECQEILERDLTKDYPGTVREVLKYYCRIMKCIMNEDISDDELDALTNQLRNLFDEQLLAANPYDFHLTSMKTERDSYKSSDSKINSYTVDTADKLVTKVRDGKEVAKLSLYFTIKNGTEFNRSFEDFLLRKDANGNWKILGWQQSESKDLDD